MSRSFILSLMFLMMFPILAHADMCKHQEVSENKCEGCHLPADIQMCFIETITVVGSPWGWDWRDGFFSDTAIFGFPGVSRPIGGSNVSNPKDKDKDGKIDCYESLTGITDKTITSHWGVNRCFNGHCKIHNGMDMRAPTGTQLYSPVTGTVVATYNGAEANIGNSTGNGNYVRINADNGTQVVLIHMEAVLPSVVAGTRVIAGQMLGTSNNSGGSFGSHLHITVYKNQNNRSTSNTMDPALAYGGQGCSA